MENNEKKKSNIGLIIVIIIIILLLLFASCFFLLRDKGTTNNSNSNNNNNTEENTDYEPESRSNKGLTEQEKYCEDLINKGAKQLDYKSFINKFPNKDDYYAIKATHDCANKHKIPVVVTKGTYNIYKKTGYNTQIKVQTNTNLNGSTIYIHDEILEYVNNKLNYKGIIYQIANDDNSCETINIKNAGSFDSIINQVNNKGYKNAYVKITDNSGKEKVFKRSGKNKNNGDAKSDVFILKDGKIQSDYNKFFWSRNSYLTNSSVYVCNISKDTVKFENAIFKTIIGEDASLKNMNGYAVRNISIARSNTELNGLTHLFITLKGGKEQLVRYTYYEHASFFNFESAANIKFNNSVVYALKVKDNTTNVSSTYDFGIGDVINMTSTNIKMYDNSVHKSIYGNNSSFMNTFDNDENGQLVADLWGVMGTNRSKYITFNNCKLNRIDAHRGILVLNVNDSVLGRHSINVTGAGDYINNELNLTNVTVKGSVKNSFITLREDYGSTWNGDIIIKNCVFESTLSNKNTAYLVYWNADDNNDYGYELYLPRITINGLKINNNKISKFYIFNKSKNYYSTLDARTDYKFTNRYWSKSSGKETISGVNLNSRNIKDYLS